MLGNCDFAEPLTYEIMRSQFDQVVKINIPIQEEHFDTALDKIKQFYFGEKPIDEITVNEICDVSRRY